VQCATAGGFLEVPFCREGSVRDERILREIEETTSTLIRMQILEGQQIIVIIVCPGVTGVVGNVTAAVRQLNSLLKLEVRSPTYLYGSVAKRTAKRNAEQAAAR
jgi:Ni,Fe-hydrogenase I small subunit